MITIRILPLGVLALLVALAILSGCAATQTFNTAARADDTVALAVGWQKTLVRDNIKVTITPVSGSPVVYQPNDSAARGIINLYTDPISNVVIGTNLNNDLDVDAIGIGSAINQVRTGADRDWWLTTLFLDLPSSLAVGTATIAISDAATNAVIQSSTVAILPGIGSANLFSDYQSSATTVGSGSNILTGSSGIYPHVLLSLERTPHVTLTFGKLNKRCTHASSTAHATVA